MDQNFFEILLAEPREGLFLDDDTVKNDLQSLLDSCTSGIGPIDFKFRKSADHPGRLLFVAGWQSKADHDDLDIRGVTPRLLQILFSIINAPLAVYYTLIDARNVDWDAEVLRVNAYHVKSQDREAFQREVTAMGIIGAWYFEKGTPSRPAVMPTSPDEIKIIEAGEARAKSRLSLPTPNIWIQFSIDENAQTTTESFDAAVKEYVSKVDRGTYEKFLSG